MRPVPLAKATSNPGAIYRFNPMTQVIDGFRWALLGTGQSPDWTLMAFSGLIGLLVLVGGLYTFRRAERSIVDVA